MVKAKITLINKLGLHARAAAKFVETANAFASQVQVGNEQRLVDAKSIMSVMLLAASNGTELHLVVDGADEQLALDAIEALINNRFGEEE